MRRLTAVMTVVGSATTAATSVIAVGAAVGEVAWGFGSAVCLIGLAVVAVVALIRRR